MTTIMKLKEPARRQRSHLSPAGRGRPSETRAAEGDLSQIDSAVPAHLDPLPAAERERAEITAAALYRLLAWMSPAYPVGAFSYSGGIEWAVEAGDIKDANTLRQWLSVMIGEGAGFADAVLFRHAHDATAANDAAALRAVAELAAALVSSKERFLETTAQGRAFADTTQAAWPTPALTRLEAVWSGPVALPIAVGVACAGHGISRGPAVRTFLQALTANWISAGIRLIPLGQTDGQHILAALEGIVAESAVRAQTMPLDELGTSALRADIAGMKHETQYTRLFRS